MRGARRGTWPRDPGLGRTDGVSMPGDRSCSHMNSTILLWDGILSCECLYAHVFILSLLQQ